LWRILCGLQVQDPEEDIWREMGILFLNESRNQEQSRMKKNNQETKNNQE